MDPRDALPRVAACFMRIVLYREVNAQCDKLDKIDDQTPTTLTTDDR